jgi:hypothetical protein
MAHRLNDGDPREGLIGVILQGTEPQPVQNCSQEIGNRLHGFYDQMWISV